MNKVLTTNTATITTATIEIKVMKIDKKQVTLAVFRQLPMNESIDLQSGCVNGIPWGRVNYHIGCDGYFTKHMHIVWQEENRLCHGIAFLPWLVSDNISYRVPQNAYKKSAKRLGDLAYAYLAARTLEGWQPEESFISHTFSQTVYIEDEAITVNTSGDDLLRTVWEYRKNPDRYADGATERLRDWLIPRYYPSSSLGILDAYLLPHYHEEYAELKQTWQQSYAQLEQLDQLFIAV